MLTSSFFRAWGVGPAHIRHLRRAPRWETEQCEQTCFPQAPQLVSEPASYPSRSKPMPVVSISSAPVVAAPARSGCPQSSQWLGASRATSPADGPGAAEGDAVDSAGLGPGRFQKLWREGCAAG